MNANPDFSNVYAIIMAGGRGTRFWPAGRYSRPKQLLAISSEETMIEITCQRLFPLFAPENILVITNREFVTEIQNLLPIPSENVIGEPVGRDTASCVALAAAILQRRDPYATMVFLPADHLIRPVQQFHKAIINAVSMAISGDYLITFGLRPEYPACGYGYIEIGENIFKHGYRVKRFLEKPDIDTAQSFFNSGNYYWNCGIFVWTIETIINEFRKYCPDIYSFIHALIDADNLEEYLEENFHLCPKISIDYAVLEKADSVLVIEADFFWNDIGSWSELKKLYPQDEDENTIVGNAVVQNTHGCIIKSDSETLVCVLDMQNLIVIQDGNGVLIYPRDSESQIKNLLQLLPEHWK